MSLLLGEILDRNCQTHPHKVAATLGDESLSFAQVHQAANRYANALRGIGVRHRDNVVWWSEMTLREVEGFCALARLGAAFAPINARFSVEEALPVVEYLRPRVIVADVQHGEMAAEVCRRFGITLAVLGGGGVTVPGHDLDALAAVSSASFATDPAVDERDPHAIFLTSGSTGVPKGVVLSHRTSWLRGSWMAERLIMPGGQPGEMVTMFPLFHWAGWSTLLMHWQANVAIHYVPSAQPELLLAAVERHRAAILSCIPGVWRRIFASGALDRFDTSSLEHVGSGTSAVSIELLSQLKQRFPGTTSSIGYGSTEGGALATLHDQELFQKPGSVGLPERYVQMRLEDDGEISTTSTALADGYFERPDATAEVFIGGWYHTGDLGTFDNEGYLTIVGRKGEVIRSGGEWIAPVEVEELLRKSVRGIRDVAVVGIADERWGEVVSVVLVLDDGVACPTVEDLRQHVSGLAAYKHPRQVFAVDAIPRTPATGQVRRALLKAQLSEQLKEN